jgi:hypothetical protein
MGSKSKISITMPDKLWLGEISRKYPSFEFRITAFVPISQEPFIGNSLISITGFLTEPVLKHIQNHPSLKELHILKESACCIDLETRTFDPLLLEAIVKNSILVNLPVVIQEGIASFEVSGSRENINKFMEFLETRNVKCELKEIGEFSQNTDYLLTPRQQEVYDAAKKSGFFEVPRKINLSTLAESLGMAKSTLSSMMQRIYAKLLGN